MKINDNFTGGITMKWKVSVDLLLLDIKILPLDNDHLLLISKICAALGSVQKCMHQKGRGPSHYNADST